MNLQLYTVVKCNQYCHQGGLSCNLSQIHLNLCMDYLREGTTMYKSDHGKTQLSGLDITSYTTKINMCLYMETGDIVTVLKVKR